MRALSMIVAAALALPVASGPAAANDGAAFVGGVVSGVILKTIIDHGTAPRARQQRRTVRPARVAQDPAVTAYWRSVQTALNAAGIWVGTADGVAGQKTRAGVRSFQTRIGAEPTGQLTPAESEALRVAAGFAPPPAAATTAAYVPAALPSTITIEPAVAAAAPAEPADEPQSSGQPDRWAGDYGLNCTDARFQCGWTIEKTGVTYDVAFQVADRRDGSKLHCLVRAVGAPDVVDPDQLVATLGDATVRFRIHPEGLVVKRDGALDCDAGGSDGVAYFIGD